MLQNYDLDTDPGFGSNYRKSFWHFTVVFFVVLLFVVSLFFFFSGVDVPVSFSCTL